MITTRRTFLGLAAAAVTIPIAGCAPGGSAPVESTAPSDVNTDPGSLPEATITTLDTWTDKASMQAQWVTAVNAAFTAKYPKLKVNRTSATFDDINKTLKLKLSDASTPDVVPANNGWQGIGTFAKAGLILNLDAYAKGYGWDKRIPATIAKMHQVAADGSQIGTGSWFGAPIAQGGFITVYFNRAKLEKLGASVPTTFDEFKQSLSAAKAAGEVPMMIGTQDQWLSTTTLFALMNVFAEKQKIADFVYGTGGAATDIGMKEAGAIYQQWAKDSYLPKNFAGTPGSDSGSGLRGGHRRLLLLLQRLAALQQRGDRQQVRHLPAARPRACRCRPPVPRTRTSPSRPRARARTRRPRTWTSSPVKEAGDIALKTGVMPFNGTFEKPAEAGALLADELTELNAVQETDGFVPYFDWASPTMLDTLGAQTQLLLAGKITPDQLVEACQKDYDAFRKSQGK